MFDKLKNLFKKPSILEPVAALKPPKPRKPRKLKAVVAPVVTEPTAKERATALGEPYVAILKVDIDPNNMHNGAFELDWNDKFLLNLIKSGYKKQDDDTDNMIVDRWFATVCRNIVLELYEQNQADPANRDLRPSNTRDLGDGRVEVS
jgi:hypothetical protein